MKVANSYCITNQNMKMIVFNKLLICVVEEVFYKLKRNKDIYRCIRPTDV